MITRDATYEDVQAIGAIKVSAWQAAYREVMPADYLAALNPTANLEGLKSMLRSVNAPFSIKVTEQKSTIVAFSISGSPRYEAPANTLELWALNVHPAHWRKGIGKTLLQASITDARKRDASKLQLWCIKSNLAACHLYESCGFIAIGQDRISSALTGYLLHEIAYEYALRP